MNGGMTMNRKVIITIDRQYGSGGRSIGEQLANDLGIPFYNKEITEMAAKQSGMSKEVFDKVDETAASSLLYSVVTGAYMFGNHVAPTLDLPINDKLFIAQTEVIKKLAKEGSCVIMGRCADYILRDDPSIINIFIHADLSIRLNRAIKEYQLASDKAEASLNKIDKNRANYYHYYSGEKWGNSFNYKLCLDSGILGIEGSVAVIKAFIKERNDRLE